MTGTLPAKGLTPKGRATRARIVEGAAAQIREHGLPVTTLDDIRARTSTSKSQLFHYFPGGREQLLLRRRRARSGSGALRPAAAPGPTHHVGRLGGVARRRHRALPRSGPDLSMAVLMTEVGRSTPAARRVTAQLMNQWEADILAGVRSMQDSGQVSNELDAQRAARALLAGIQGGVTIMMATGDLSHLEAALDTGIEGLQQL